MTAQFYWMIVAAVILTVIACFLVAYTLATGILWVLHRYHDDRRRARLMMRDFSRPWTGRAAIVSILLLCAVALWVLVPPALADAQYTVTVSDYCNVREEPRKDSPDAGDLYAGDTVTGIGYQDGWVLVEAAVEAGTGWVRADLLTLVDYPIGKYTNTSGGRVRMRAEPDGKAVGWLKAGGTVDVIRWTDVDGVAWAYTDKGYIKSDYLEVE
ncbi:MAG: SH3 domain-containing protein [Candidatus Limiplasma sp.]|nr:SH3 domain-containing protein [Candidatus Limiplasma sp.]